MRYVFGLASLVVVLGVVAWLAKTQLNALAGLSPAATAAGSASAATATPAQVSRDLQQKFKADVEQALKQSPTTRSEP